MPSRSRGGCEAMQPGRGTGSGRKGSRRRAARDAGLSPLARAWASAMGAFMRIGKLILRGALWVLWPVWGLLWGFMQRHKTRSSERTLIDQALGATESADNYKAWAKQAALADRLSGYDQWAGAADGSFNHKVLSERVMRIEDILAAKDAAAGMVEIKSALHRHMAGITNVEVCRYWHGTKKLIVEYQDAVVALCEMILTDAAVDPMEKFLCFDHACKSFGRSALLLSGGGALGLYHTGVCKALLESGTLPSMISGSSAGSIIAAMFCTKTDDELFRIIDEELDDPLGEDLKSFSLNAFDSDVFDGQHNFLLGAKRALKGEAFMSNENLRKSLQANVGDLTFAEAHAKTGRVLNISVAFNCTADTHPLQLNYITSPHVVIWSAVVASCSVPGLFSRAALLLKDARGELVSFNPAHRERYFDGSIAADLPQKQLRELFNVDFFIVSQTNPHVVPFVQREHRPPPHPALHLSFLKSLRLRMTRSIRGLAGELGHLTLLTGRLFPPFSHTPLYRILDQHYTGDITIWPGVGWADYLGLILNPTASFLRQTVSRGQKKTWPLLNRITQCTRIEGVINCSRARAKKMLDFDIARTEHMHAPTGHGEAATPTRGGLAPCSERRHPRATVCFADSHATHPDLSDGASHVQDGLP
eukprot:TRINITY_DN6027_c0_g2_i1.p1 TRINITY_DN6027_c0_g2~~TRINITY_DN6027_c0_g2_i1.p1  ORF type:complete len:647 (+),score=147.18 TRINITY_DN6027_c0_g2_i1:29-1969(+)